MRFHPTWLAIPNVPPRSPEDAPTTDIRLRDVMLVGVLPTAAALIAAMVILVERLQIDPSGAATSNNATPLMAWYSCVLAFAVAHLAGSWIAWRTDAAGWLLRLVRSCPCSWPRTCGPASRTKGAGGANRCWLNLDDWPTPGDAVRAEADCHAPWLEQVARLRVLLEARFGFAR